MRGKNNSSLTSIGKYSLMAKFARNAEPDPEINCKDFCTKSQLVGSGLAVPNCSTTDIEFEGTIEGMGDGISEGISEQRPFYPFSDNNTDHQNTKMNIAQKWEYIENLIRSTKADTMKR